LLARFNLDSRTQRFLLSQLAVIKERGKAYVLEQFDNALVRSSIQSFVSDDSSRKAGAQPALHVLFSTSDDQKEAMGERSREDIARRLLQKRQEALKRPEIEAALDFLEQWVNVAASPANAFATIERIVSNDEMAQPMLDTWRTVIDLLAIYEIPPARITIQPALARSWEYYSGIVFELRTGADLHLGGGGRYDELPRLIGGRHDVPAVGFAYYVDQMLTAIPSPVHQSNDAVYIALADGNDRAAARWAQHLRSCGITVALCPGDKLDIGQRRLLVNSDGSAYFGDESYTLSESESLATRLSESKNVQ
jgi:histidyl-tRNA synthetase